MAFKRFLEELWEALVANNPLFKNKTTFYNTKRLPVLVECRNGDKSKINQLRGSLKTLDKNYKINPRRCQKCGREDKGCLIQRVSPHIARTKCNINNR